MHYLLALVLLFVVLTSAPGFATAKGDIKRGQKVFQAMQCAVCHEDGGNKLNPQRPLKGPLFTQRYPLGDNKELEKTIREGITNKGMPSFTRDKLSDQNLLDLMAYVRSLTPPAKKSK